MQYLILDKNDITNVIGTIDSKNLLKELDMNHSQLNMFITYGKTFRGKYILIEDFEANERKSRKSKKESTSTRKREVRAVALYKDNKLINVYPSVAKAASSNGLNTYTVYRSCRYIAKTRKWDFRFID